MEERARGGRGGLELKTCAQQTLRSWALGEAAILRKALSYVRRLRKRTPNSRNAVIRKLKAGELLDEASGSWCGEKGGGGVANCHIACHAEGAEGAKANVGGTPDEADRACGGEVADGTAASSDGKPGDEAAC